MARINIEDSLWKDDRFQDLMIRVGSRHTAKGMVLELWALAQEFWFPERKLIPRERIQRSGLDLMLDVGLAVEREGGIFAVGTEKAFDWLFQKQSAGKKGGRPKASVKRPKAGAKRAQANESGPNPLTPTLIPSPVLIPNSGSLISKEAESEKSARLTAGKSGEAGEGGPTVWQTWESYRDAYANRHGEAPPWNSKQAGMIKQFMARIPAAEAPGVAAFYVSHNGSRYVQAMHPLGLLLMDAEKIRTEWATGNQMTTSRARQADKQGAYQSQLERIARGEL